MIQTIQVHRVGCNDLYYNVDYLSFNVDYLLLHVSLFTRLLVYSFTSLLLVTICHYLSLHHLDYLYYILTCTNISRKKDRVTTLRIVGLILFVL